MAKFITLPGARPADEGEALVVNHLKNALPETYTLIPNLEIRQRGAPAYELDLVVIAPHAVYVVEIKRWLGGIEGDDYSWRIGGLHLRLNPWPTVNNKARVLKSLIRERQPACAEAWVEAVVAIADETGALNLQGASRERVFRYSDLVAFLRDPAALEGKASDLRPLRAYLEKAVLETGRGRPSGPLRYGNYEVKETLSRRDAVAEFLARNVLLPNSPDVRLRVFSYAPYLPPADLALHLERIRREAEALQKIGAHPNLISLRGFETAAEDPNLFLEITDWSEEGTLRSVMSGAPLSLDRQLELAAGIAAGLKAAHAAGVIHRDLRPENILIGRDGQPKVMNFNHARMETSSSQTVGPFSPDPDVPLAYRAPELLLPHIKATPASDLYSLGCILFELLVGEPLYHHPDEARDLEPEKDGPLAFGVRDIPPRLNELICGLMQRQASCRPQQAGIVLEELRSIQALPSGTVVESLEPVEEESIPLTAQFEREPETFEVGELIDGKYQVQKVLNPGGSGRVYRVYDGMADRVYALKVFANTALSEDFLRKELRLLLNLSHPNIVRVYGWDRLPQSGRYYLVSEYIEGEELHAYTRSPDRRLSARQGVRAIIELLNALEAIHPPIDEIEALRLKMETEEPDKETYQKFLELRTKGLLHRDIKPENLLLSKDGLKLIDFNIAARASEARRTVAGTPGYMLPEIGSLPWSADADLFATGVVLYELITGRHPYPDRQPTAEIPPIDPRQWVSNLSPHFAELLQRAASCDAQIRYHTARQFHQDLLALDEDYFQDERWRGAPGGLALEPAEMQRPNYNPYVTRWLRLYSQARCDNSGTRGLDEAARLTYVDTRLDRILRPAILDGRYRLVIITGNAGDGKTAFIQNLQAAAGAPEEAGANTTTFQYAGRTFVANYDGSQDEGEGRANIQVLREYFAPFTDGRIETVDSGTPTHLIAINEGRLVDFFSPGGAENGNSSNGDQLAFSKLGRYITAFFDPSGVHPQPPDWLLIVDLNQRSVVARDPDQGNTSIFERQLQEFLKPKFWQACAACDLREQCFIKFNADTLADPVSGPAVRERLRMLFEVVALRRQIHITMRDLRSALSWLLFRDHSCEDVAQLLGSPTFPEDRLAYVYANAFAPEFAPLAGQGEDRLVRLLRQVDPAQTANPETDRLLHFKGLDGLPLLAFEGRSSLVQGELNEWQLPAGWEASEDADAVARRQRRHAFLRRMAFFERRDGGWLAMLPYRNLEDFRSISQTGLGDLEKLKRTLARGFSTLEGARHPTLVERHICVRAGQPTRAKIKSFRLFPLEDFKIQLPDFPGRRFLEHTPDHILFYHDPAGPDGRLAGARRAELVVSLDLLELLSQVQEGYTPSPDDQRGIFINLLVFKNALTHLPYRRALLTRDDQQYYELKRMDAASVVLRRWSTEMEVG